MIQTLWILCLLAVNPSETVINGAVPEGKPMTISFVKDLRVGPNGDDDHMLWSGSIVTMAASSQGHMYVLDGGGLRVIQFDENGKFVRQIGSQGEAPGEFQKLSNLSILEDDRLVVSEFRLGQNVINYFDSEGIFIERTSGQQKTRMFSALASPDGAHLGGSFFQAEDNNILKVTFGMLSKDLKVELAIVTYDLPDVDGTRMGDPNWWPEFLGPWFKMQPNQGLVAFGNDGTIFTALTGKYEITRYSSDMKKKLVFNRKYKPKALSEKDQNAILEPIREQVLAAFPSSIRSVVTDQVIKKSMLKANLAPVSSPIYGLIPLEDGGLLVVHTYNPETYHSIADMFDVKGKLTGSVKLPPVEINFFGGYYGFSAKMWFKNGFAYTIESVNEEYYLTRYKYAIVPQ